MINDTQSKCVLQLQYVRILIENIKIINGTWGNNSFEVVKSVYSIIKRSTEVSMLTSNPWSVPVQSSSASGLKKTKTENPPKNLSWYLDTESLPLAAWLTELTELTS